MRHPWKILAISLLVFAFFPLKNGHASRSVIPLAGVHKAEPGPTTRVYVVPGAVDETQVLELRRRLIGAGVKNVNLFLPSKTIVCEVPRSVDLRALIGDSRYELIEEPVLEAGRAAGAGASRAGDDIGFIRGCYLTATRSRATGAVREATADGDRGGFVDVVRRVPREIVELSRERAGMSTVAGGVQERTTEQNSEFLAGDVLMLAVLPESEGNGENWTAEAIASALQGGFGAGIAYQQRFSIVPMHFIFSAEEEVSTPYEPIQTTMEDHPTWIMDVMAELGIPAMQSAELMAHEYNNRKRAYYQTDWVFTAFVANSENAPNHRFADQWYTAYANLGGPYMVMPHPAGENPFGIDPVLVYSTVYQHEMGHIFWALDEYPAEFNLSQCTSRTGYLNYTNENKVTRMIDGTERSCPGHEAVECIMWRAKEDLGRPVCHFTSGQIGTIDNNNNTIPDVYDAAPTVEFETALVETVETPDIAINMKAISLPVLNRNPLQEPDSRMSYAAPLKDASLTVNGIGPVHLKPLDGKWDDVEEDLTLVLNGLPVGMSQIAVTARNVSGRASNPVIKTIFFAGIKYALFDVDVREKGIHLSWSTVGDAFGARLDLHRIDVESGVPDTTVLVSNMEPKDERDPYVIFEYFDTSVKPGYEYSYFVRGYFSIEYPDTTVEYASDSGTFGARSMFPISSGSLTSNVSPNPFSEFTNISVRVPASFSSSGNGLGSVSYTGSAPVQTEIEINVYDVAGRLVTEVYRGRQFGGVQTFTWDGTNSRGGRVPSGIYFIKTAAGGATEVKKVVLVR